MVYVANFLHDINKGRTRLKGLFITFEGGEGAGKSTQIKLLAEHLQAKGLDVVITREPGGTPGAEAVRAMLLAGEAEIMGPLAEAGLFAAARCDHMEQVISPALKAGKVVLCDRFIDSTRVYQGAILSADVITFLEECAIGNIRPQLTFILDLPAKIGMSRIAKRRNKTVKVDRFEKESLAVQEARRQAFLAIAAKEPERCKVINASHSKNAVADEIFKIIDTYLGGTENANG